MASLKNIVVNFRNFIVTEVCVLDEWKTVNVAVPERLKTYHSVGFLEVVCFIVKNLPCTPVATLTHWTHLEFSDHWWALACRVELDRCQDIHLFSLFMALSCEICEILIFDHKQYDITWWVSQFTGPHKTSSKRKQIPTPGWLVWSQKLNA